MADNLFTEGVKPGGLTTGTETRILLCYLLDSVDAPVSREQIQDALLGEELANYFLLAEGLGQLLEQGLITGDDTGYSITESGRTVGKTLADDLPRTIRDAAVRGVIRAQRYAAKEAVHQCEIVKGETGGRQVRCAIVEPAGALFEMNLYMPDTLSAEAVRGKFVESGDEVYALVLAALTDDEPLARRSLEQLKNPRPEPKP